MPRVKLENGETFHPDDVVAIEVIEDQEDEQLTRWYVCIQLQPLQPHLITLGQYDKDAAETEADSIRTFINRLLPKERKLKKLELRRAEVSRDARTGADTSEGLLLYKTDVKSESQIGSEEQNHS
jgi:hypothetical protein